MGSLLSKAFIPPGDLLGCAVDMTGVPTGEEGVVTCLDPFSEPDWYWGLIQVFSLMLAYGYVLFYASNMLSEGSELLLLVPSLSGIVGSVVLPILGAVPDGAIMLFSGLGPDAQNQLSVGVGALAGSTIMLLTIPWGLSIIYGRMPLGANGKAMYGSRKRPSLAAGRFGQGVTPEGTIRTNACLMMGTALIYLIIQGPAFRFSRQSGDEPGIHDEVVEAEHDFALVGLIAASVSFCGYIWLMTKQSAGSGTTQEYIITQTAVKAIDSSLPVTLAGVIAPIIDSSVQSASAGSDGLARLSGELLDNPGKAKLAAMLKPFFRRYDANGDGHMSALELLKLLTDIGEEVTPEGAEQWMRQLDPNQSGSIEMDEFTDAMLTYIKQKARTQLAAGGATPGRGAGAGAGVGAGAAPTAAMGEADDGDDDDDEEEEMPEEFAHLSPEQQQRMIKRKAFGMMAVALSLILLFSDPMVDVMSNVGERVGIPPFYVAFVMAPLASNASELIASLAYAAKKTRKTITVSLSALEGAACMNNTFCLAIFMGLIYFKGLAWKFSAETIAILVVECIIAIVALQPTMTMTHAVLALLLFPGSIAFVAILESAGYD